MNRLPAAVAFHALLGAAAGAAALLLFYGVNPTLSTDLSETPPPRQVSGLYPVERDGPSGLTFAWTGETFAIRLPGLDRRTDWRLIIRMRGARANPADNPDVTFTVDGNRVLTYRASAGFEGVIVPVPARADRRGAFIAAQSSSTIVPGPSDPRSLGVMLDSISLRANGWVTPPRHALIDLAIAGASTGAAIALVGAAPMISGAAVVVVVTGLAALVARGFGPFTEYADLLSRASVWFCALTVVTMAAIRAVRRVPWSVSARFVAGFSAAAALLKLAVLLHPDMPVGDAMFHAHRFQYVLGGNLYFTSIAPGNYSFPYAPGLYVFAMPFADLVRRGSGDMALLRTIVISIDALAATMLYLAPARAGSPRTGAIAVVFYHLMPLEFRIATVGNLTNAFAHALSVISFALLGAYTGSHRNLWYPALLIAVLACAFLSHTSTFAVVSLAGLLIAACFVFASNSAWRWNGIAVGAAVLAASVVAIALYYGHFLETYRTEWARISGETVAAAPAPGGRSILQRVSSVPRYLSIYFGIPTLALAACGFVIMRRRRDPLALAVAGWTAACLFFLAVGLVTPVDMRYYLTAIPALAVVAAASADAWWTRGRIWRLLAALLFAWSVAIGVQTWWSTLG
jgi:hypothetical protein